MEHAEFNFHMSTMGGGKTLELMVDRYRKANANFPTLIAKPVKDKKASEKIRTRFGDMEQGVDLLIDEDDDVSEIIVDTIATRRQELGRTALLGRMWIVYVDEAQFLTRKQVVSLRRDIVDADRASVEAYGLTTDFQGNFFPGSEALLKLADHHQQIGSYCEYDSCNRPALFNARYENGEMVKTGPQVAIDGVDATYRALCSRHYFEGTDE